MNLKYLVLAILVGSFANGQTVGPIELTEMTGYGMKKIAESPKKVFIETFKVNYQIFGEKQESEQGGRVVGGGVRGDVKVKLSIGLEGIQEKALVESTDRIYKEFVDRLKKEGYEIVPFENAIGLKEFEGWERVKGGVVSKSQYRGYASVSPTGYEYFVKRLNDEGKERGTFMDNGAKVSKELDEALVIKVTITVPFCRDAESTGSKLLGKISKGIINVVMETELGLGNELLRNSTIPTLTGATAVSVFRGGKKMGDYSTNNWLLKDEVLIAGAIEKKKFSEGAVANRDVFGSDFVTFQLFSADNIALNKMNFVKVDMPTYQKGVEMGAGKFLTLVVDELMKYANK
jgi:hypothetical protein